MKNRSAQVCIDGRHAGMLHESDAKVTFQYAGDWLADPTSVPISLTLPLRVEPYAANDNKHCNIIIKQ